MEYVYQMYDLNKFYGTRQVLKNICLSFFPGAKIGVVGENGSGKSTLLRIMAGLDDDFHGTAAPTKGVRVGYVPQEPQLDPTCDVKGNLLKAFGDITALLTEFDTLSEKMCEAEGDEYDKIAARMAVVQDKIDAADGWNLDQRISLAANALVLPPDDADVTKLSGGERRRVALARAILEQPDILLLDEPTNHLDAETIAWLEEQLREYPGTVIIVTHDRYFLDNVTKWILELENGHGIPFEGNYSSWLEQKINILAKQEKSPERRKSLERELKWIRMNTSQHRELSRQRLADYERLLAAEIHEDETDVAIRIAPAEHLGDQVLEFNAIAKHFGTAAPLFENVTFNLPKGAVVGLIGPNGTGKTTLFKLATGQEKPDAGTITVGSTVRMAHVDQFRDDLNGDNTIYDEIREGCTEIAFGKRTIPPRAYVGRFNFKGTDQQKLVRDLSGGERNRVHLAKILKSGANLILLDEPTNDLDVNTLRMLEDAINGFAGCVMVISHDRFFLNRICSHLLAFEGEGKVRWFEGNFEDYENTRRKELGDAFENRRARYRRII